MYTGSRNIYIYNILYLHVQYMYNYIIIYNYIPVPVVLHYTDTIVVIK